MGMDADPVLPDTGILEAECRKKGIPLYLYEGANYSLEVPNVQKNLEIKNVLTGP